MDYREQLKTKKWKELSEKVKDYYDHACVGCGTNQNLNTHHKRYYKNRKAWEYEIKDLVVLCKDCHNLFHENLDKLKDVATDNRLYYSYEFDQIIKMVELICKVNTNDYIKIIAHLEALTKYSF